MILTGNIARVLVKIVLILAPVYALTLAHDV